MKVGYEVEGKYKGLKSIFIEYNELIEAEEFLEKYSGSKIHQVYITDHDNEMNEDELIVLDSLNNKGYLITVETKNPVDYLLDRNIHIMLYISTNEFFKLKETDSFKFHSIKNEVYSATKENLFFTKPEDFLDDEIIS